MKITIDDIEFEESLHFQPIEEGLHYKNKWYIPIQKYNIGDWIIFRLQFNLEIRKIISNEEGEDGIDNNYKNRNTSSGDAFLITSHLNSLTALIVIQFL